MDADARREKKSPWSARTLIRYLILQVPAAALVVLLLIFLCRWLNLPGWFFWGGIAFWVVKDVVLYPFLWRSYDPDSPEEKNSMVGERGVAEDRLNPSGYVRVRGELWKAEVTSGGPPVNRGEGVRVHGVRGLTLLVQRDSKCTRGE